MNGNQNDLKLVRATLDCRQQWGSAFKIIRENHFQPSFLCSAEFSIGYEGRIRKF